jgi:hypothetical protein
MESVVVEREYETAADLDAMERTGESIAWCYEQHNVTHVGTLASTDYRRLLCLYRAPDAESVRTVQRTASFDYVRAWTSEVVGTLTSETYDCMIVERVLDQPITASAITALLGGPPHVASHLSRDGLRLTSVYSADPPAIELPVPVASERRWAAKYLTKR